MLTEEDLKRLEWKTPDYAEMSEQDFLRLLKAVTDLVELEAIANRKRISIVGAQGWNNFQRQAILRRKWELEMDEERSTKMMAEARQARIRLPCQTTSASCGELDRYESHVTFMRDKAEDLERCRSDGRDARDVECSDALIEVT